MHWREAEAEPSHTDDVGSITRLVLHDPQAFIVAEERQRIVGSIVAGWEQQVERRRFVKG